MCKCSISYLQITSPIASIFIVLQHNVTAAGGIPLYSPGVRDWAAVFFYSLICIVVHAIIQEYVLDVSMNYFAYKQFLIKIIQDSWYHIYICYHLPCTILNNFYLYKTNAEYC